MVIAQDFTELEGSVVRGLVSVLYHVLSLEKKLFSILSLSTQLYKWLPALFMLLKAELSASLDWERLVQSSELDTRPYLNLLLQRSVIC